MAEGIYKYRKEKPKKVYRKPQIGFGSLSYASDKKKRYEKPSVSVKMKADRELAKHDTEVGHSEGLKKALHNVEENTRNLKDEQLHLFDKDGKELYKIQGKGATVNPDAFQRLALRTLATQNKDAVMTHNHPRAIGKSGFGGIGHSFSPQDMMTAVSYDVAEMRAATPTFTFSFKRPKNGWNATPQQVKRAYSREANKLRKELLAHEEKRNRMTIVRETSRSITKAFSDRADVWFYNELNKRIAKKFGWDYSSRQHHRTQR